jgi:uncharacterized protein (DUF3084 family)
MNTTISGNTPTYSSKSPKNNLTPLFLTIGFLLLLGVAWLTYKSMSTTRTLEQKIAELEESEKLKAELENQYNQAIAELDQLKSDNDQINAMIESQKAELAAQKSRISVLLRDKSQLDAARNEIKTLKTRLAQYIADIEQLRAEKQQLTDTNVQLKTETSTLSSNLQTATQENQQLETAKATLTAEKEELSKSVTIGSVIKVKDITVVGQKVRKSGKTAERERAKRVDQLKVCFTALANELTQAGTEKFFIRIINPKGETLAIEDLGQGSTTDIKTGEALTVTQVQELAYAKEEAQLCFLWKPAASFLPGKYNVEIYNKGYLAGNGSFELK